MEQKEISQEKIVIKMPNWLGDAVLAAGFLNDLRTYRQRSDISIFIESWLAPIFKEESFFDTLIPYERPSGWLRRIHPLSIIETLKTGRFDQGILLTNSFTSTWWFWRGGVKERIGYDFFPRNWLLTKPVPFPETTLHQAELYRRLLVPLGITPSNLPPRLTVTREEKKKALMRLEDWHEKDEVMLIGIHPGASFGSAKCWPKESFHTLAKNLLAYDKRIHLVFLGTANQTGLIKEIIAPFNERVLSLAGKTGIRDLMATLSCLRVLVTNDSGPMHVAASLSVPVVALFGSTDPKKSGPLGPATVLYKPPSCSPCFRRTCPIGLICLKAITPNDVLEAVCKWI